MMRTLRKVRSRIETMLPDEENRTKDRDKVVEKFEEGLTVVYPHSTPQARRFRFVSSVDVLVAIGGDTGTEQNLLLAFALGVPTLPVPQFAGAKTRRLCTDYADEVQRWFGIVPQEWKNWTQTSGRDMSSDDVKTLAGRVRKAPDRSPEPPVLRDHAVPARVRRSVQDAIKPAVEGAGLLPVRTDKLNAPARSSRRSARASRAAPAPSR